VIVNSAIDPLGGWAAGGLACGRPGDSASPVNECACEWMSGRSLAWRFFYVAVVITPRCMMHCATPHSVQPNLSLSSSESFHWSLKELMINDCIARVRYGGGGGVPRNWL